MQRPPPPPPSQPGRAKEEKAPDVLRDANEKLVLAALHSEERAEASAKEEAIFNALPDAVARFNRQQRPVYFNASAERFTGRSRAELLERTTEELGLPAELAVQWESFLRAAFARETSAEAFFTFEGPVRRTFHVRTVLERDAKGAVESLVAIAREVTESELYQRARADADRLRRLQSITAAFSEASTPAEVASVLATQAHEALQSDAAMVMLLDGTGRTLELASAVGYPDEVVGHWSAIPIEASAPLTDVVRTQAPLFFASHGMVGERYPWLAGARHGDDRALAVIPLAFKQRAFGAVALVFRRSHEFADADRAFLASLAECAAQAIDRARLLEAERIVRREAETANRLKDEFLATMSHELRTPLNAVMGWVTILQTETLDTAAMRRAIDSIDRNARAQARLVEDILDVSRITAGNLRLDTQPTDAAAVVRAAVDVVGPAAEAKQIDLRLALADACVVSTDAARLQQIVWNLVSNAVKFTPERGRIDVSVERTQAGVTIEVADTGAGIDPDFLPHVFDRFRQYDGSTTRRKGGLGLGLAIVRHLVELHGGSVAAHSDGPGRGATFKVMLPVSIVRDEPPRVAAGAAGPVPKASHAAPALTGLRILVVDDDPDVREVLCAALVIWGAEVSSAESAPAALMQLASIRPDLLVCDIGMPEMDGYALMRELRARPASAGGLTPAIAVTGFARPEDVKRAIAAGFQLHVAKPVDLGTLAPKLARLVGRDVGGEAS
ncbi:MAG TPA: ATP-binding protein [Polyangiaceae bacterium]|jgi:hypothetical protein|nr:ATP-binding protein [Polyangiaceae bacterium]